MTETPDKNGGGYFEKYLLEDFSRDRYKALYDFGFIKVPENISPSLDFLHELAIAFISALTNDGDIELSRRAAQINDEAAQTLLHRVPFALGLEYVSLPWIHSLWKELAAVFKSEIDAAETTVFEYLKSKNSVLTVAGRVFFHLVEYHDAEHPFAFIATYSTGSADKVSHLPLKNALTEYGDDTNQLLSLLKTVGNVCEKSAFISGLSESGELFSPLRFTRNEAYTFLTEAAVYEECGVICRIPDWWRKKSGTKITVSVGEKAPSELSLDALLSFNASIYLEGLELTREEIEALLSETSGLSFLKGKWVEVDHEKLKAALLAFDKIDANGNISFAEAMRMELGLSSLLTEDDSTSIVVKNGEWLSSIIDRLKKPAAADKVSPGEDFHAALRHYQQSGLNWLLLMYRLKFGALLADDMGLGKTVQILALLEHIRENGGAKTLLIIPASLIFNWQSEAARFAPKLKTTVLHAKNKEFDLDEADVFITTYGMLLRIPKISEAAWDLVILDEAQAIKNAGTRQSKAVRKLHTKAKIAMTGTPVENRLSDLWSLFDFLNCGLLGSAKEFTNFIKRLKNDSTGYMRLREIVSPFILRRLKTDQSVIADLPDKIEIKALTGLNKKQLVLYKSLLRELEAALKAAEGIKRKGLVLSSILKFKQICNHPDQYLGQTAFEPSHSGKFEKLAEICETIAEKRERALVFTQFKEMTEPLNSFLAEVFGQKGLVLHGGTPIKKRGELVEHFNSEDYVPYMVLSLKAGGVGLNLTSANHVIHFDRWWNPAVENQATDRAFRIGQKKDVLVHKFVTAGTLEEKIDKMINDKLKLADEVIASGGENWITELDNSELMRLFKLEV